MAKPITTNLPGTNSPSQSVSVRLPASQTARLAALASHLGRSKADILRQAITEHLADLEELYGANQTLSTINAGQHSIPPLGSFFQPLAVVDARDEDD